MCVSRSATTQDHEKNDKYSGSCSFRRGVVQESVSKVGGLSVFSAIRRKKGAFFQKYYINDVVWQRKVETP